MDGGWDLNPTVPCPAPPTSDEGSSVAEHRHQLLEEERIALGGLAHALDDGLGCVREQGLCQAPGVGGLERRERGRHDARLSRSPARSAVEKLGPGEAHHEQGTMEPIDDRFHDVKHRLLGRMRVVEDHHKRLFGRQ